MTSLNPHITHCLEQIERFAFQIGRDVHPQNRFKQFLQFGYNYGRLMVITENDIGTDKHDQTDFFSCDLISKATEKIDVNDPHNIMLFGFIIGVLQECTTKDHTQWWQPLDKYVINADMISIQQITLQNIEKYSLLSNIKVKIITDFKELGNGLYLFTHNITEHLEYPHANREHLLKY